MTSSSGSPASPAQQGSLPHADDHRVADIALYGFGRNEIRLAEHEMPGLMALRAEFVDEQPLA